MSLSDFICFNDRLKPKEQSAGYDFDKKTVRESYQIPVYKILVITDIVIQNREPGDEPVADTDFSRVEISGDPQPFYLTVVGNATINIHFMTGIRVKGSFQVKNLPNSTATFIEYIINGYLANRPAGF